MDAEDIKQKIKSHVKSEYYACGKSLRWAVNDLNTFKYYENLKCRREDMFFIFKKAFAKGSAEVREYLLNHPEYEKNRKILNENYPKDFYFKMCKSKNIATLEKFLNENAFCVEEIGKISLICGLSGSLKCLKLIVEKIPKLTLDIIAPNACRGANTANFPEILAWADKLFGKKIAHKFVL